MMMFSLTAAARVPAGGVLAVGTRGAGGSVVWALRSAEADASAGRAVLEAGACCCCLSAVACLAFSTAKAILAGQVGSRGECRSFLGVAEKRTLRSVEGSAVFFSLAHAVQFEVIIPLNSHFSAGCVSAQYGHIISYLQYVDV